MGNHETATNNNGTHTGTAEELYLDHCKIRDNASSDYFRTLVNSMLSRCNAVKMLEVDQRNTNIT